jgi:hypothetical protein
MAEIPRIWLRSEASFPMIDPVSGTRFEPGTAVRADHTDWVKSQPVIKRTANPDDSPTEKDLQKIADLNAADELARQERERTAEHAQRLANGKLPVEDAVAQAVAPAPVAVDKAPA